jgi:hypothetical protein
MAKRIRISSDNGSSWNTLPGSTGEFRNEGNQIPDTIFGQNFASALTGMINATITSNALYKGFAGYHCDIFKGATSGTAFTTEAMTLVSGKTYRINDATKNMWNRAGVFNVFDNAVNHNADVESIDYLFGEVTFASGYTVTGPVTVTGSYLAKSLVAKGRSFTLTMSQEPIQDSVFEVAQANGGRHTYINGLKTVELELGSVYDSTNAWRAALEARNELIIEIAPVGNEGTESRARGIFKLTQDSQQGDVGALEEETINFVLSVPDTPVNLLTPFKWQHPVGTTLSVAVQAVLNSWQNETIIDAQYLPDGTTGVRADVLINECSLTGGLEVINDFAVTLQITGAITAVP